MLLKMICGGYLKNMMQTTMNKIQSILFQKELKALLEKYSVEIKFKYADKQYISDDAFEDKTTFIIPAKSAEVRTHSGSLYGDLRFVLPEVDEDSLPIEKVTAKRYNTLTKGRINPSFIVRQPDGTALPITKHQIALDQFLILSVEDSSVNMICDLKTGSVKNIETHEPIGELEFELQKKMICVVTFDCQYQHGIWVRTMLGEYVSSTQVAPNVLLDLICDQFNLTEGEYEDNVRNIKITELEESYEIKYTRF